MSKNTPLNADAADAPKDPPSKTAKQAVMDEAKFFAGLISFLMIFYTLVFGHYKIPSESMQPTLEVGDHLYVSKFAYGYSRHSIPLGLQNLPIWPDGKIFSRLPKRGDVVVFRNPNTGVVMIKRALGLPGDEITVSAGRFFLNGEIIDRKEVETFAYREDNGSRSIFDKIFGRNKNHERWGYKITSTEYTEQWPGEDAPHRIYEISDNAELDNTRPMVIPEGTVFMIGDNRDRSFDSRADPLRGSPGFVPVEYIIGRADRMMFSFKTCVKEKGVRCPPRRFMKKL